MCLEMKLKRAVLNESASKHQSSLKKSESQVLEEFLELSGYNLCYGS